MSNAPAATYPPAERLDLVEQLHGHDVADPYRWLEDPADPRTIAWSAAQDELCRAHLHALPGRETLTGRLTELISAGSVSVPVWRAGRSFFTRRGPGQEHPVLHVREPAGTERVLLDPAVLDPSGATTLDSWTPSIEGDRLAYQVSVGGDEESLLHVLDVASGELIDGPIDRCRYSPVAWLPGGEELFYVRRLPPSEVPDGENQFHRRVWRHRVGADPHTDDQLLDGPGLYDDLTYYFDARVSRDGRWLLVTAAPGTAPRNSLWIADLADGGQLRTVLSQDDAVRCVPWVERDGRLYLLTTAGAPRWRLCVTDPSAPQREHWRELVGEQPDSVLDGARWLDTGGDPPLVLRTRHAVAELHLHDPATGCQHGGEQAEADGSQAQAPGGVEHQHRPGRPERDVEDQDRQDQGADRGVVQRPPQAFQDAVPHAVRAAAAAAVRGQHDPRHQHQADGDQDGFGHERPGGAGDKQRRAERRTGQLVEGDQAGLQPGVGDGQIVAVHQHRRQRHRGVVGEDLGGGQQTQRHQRHGHRHSAGEHRDDQGGQHHGAGPIRRNHDQATVEHVGQDTGVQAEHQRRRPTQQCGQRDQKRVLGQRCHQQGARGHRQTVTKVGDPRRRQ